MAPEHIVRSFDEELAWLRNAIARMGGLAERQLSEAITALVNKDADLASRVVAEDSKVDDLENEIDEHVLRMLTRRQPVAVDLRQILSALRIAADLERIADYAANVAKRVLALVQLAPVRNTGGIPRMARSVQEMIKDVLDSYVTRSIDKAVQVWNRDEEVDEMYSALFRELLTYMMEDPRNITPCTHLLFIAKNIERIGDHATNIAETVHFLVKGQTLPGARPKGDETAFAVMKPGEGNGPPRPA